MSEQLALFSTEVETKRWKTCPRCKGLGDEITPGGAFVRCTLCKGETIVPVTEPVFAICPVCKNKVIRPLGNSEQMVCPHCETVFGKFGEL